jgi:branched-chain amino acid aminotransferase
MKSFCYHKGQWVDGLTPIISSMSHTFLYAKSVFDGARAYNNLVPDLDLHCARLINSAKVMGLNVDMTSEQIVRLSLEGIAKFPPKTDLYLRPVFYSNEENLVGVMSDAFAADFALTIMEVKMPTLEQDGVTACLSSYRRPHPLTAPTLAKATCLYPINGLARIEAKRRGFQSAVMRDLEGQVLELATANLWFAKDGVVYTPAPADNYLNGITRQRILGLFKKNQVKVVEKIVSVDDLLAADEFFFTGNMSKVSWIKKFEDKEYAMGPFYKMASQLYSEYAATQTIALYQEKYALHR